MRMIDAATGGRAPNACHAGGFSLHSVAMITEIAELRVRPEDRAAFIEAITRALATVLSKARGYHRHAVFACQETPGRFVLHVEWETLEDHTVGFRESPAFAQWRAIIGPYFAQAPQVEHFDLVDAKP